MRRPAMSAVATSNVHPPQPTLPRRPKRHPSATHARAARLALEIGDGTAESDAIAGIGVGGPVLPIRAGLRLREHLRVKRLALSSVLLALRLRHANRLLKLCHAPLGTNTRG